MSEDDGMQGAGTRPTAFLSYSHADQDRVRLLANALEQAGISVWWDTLIEGGAVFAKSVEIALARCDAVIVRGVEAIAGRPIEAAAYQGKLHAPGSPPPARMTRRAMLLVAGGTALAGAAVVFAWRSGRPGGGPTAAAENSVAVLPFKNISGDTSQDYFSDGLSEELRSVLARNLKLQVMAQASSAKFHDRTEDAVTIASRLGVAHLLDGTVRKSGEIARITADLIDGRTGFSRWSQSFDRSLHDIFAVQSEIARTVASALDVGEPGRPELPDRGPCLLHLELDLGFRDRYPRLEREPAQRENGRHDLLRALIFRIAAHTNQRRQQGDATQRPRGCTDRHGCQHCPRLCRHGCQFGRAPRHPPRQWAVIAGSPEHVSVRVARASHLPESRPGLPAGEVL